MDCVPLPNSKEKMVEMLFKHFDVDDDGYLNIDEFNTMCNSLEQEEVGSISHSCEFFICFEDCIVHLQTTYFLIPYLD